jgi:hypothetical protein
MNRVRSCTGPVSFHGIAPSLTSKEVLPMSPVCSVTYVAGLYPRSSGLRPAICYYRFTFPAWAEAAEL